MRSVLAPLIGPYVMGAKLLSDRFVRFARNNYQRPRGKWALFGLTMVVLSFAAIAFIDYVDGVIAIKARCPAGYYCDPATMHTVMRYANAISALMYWATLLVGVAILIRVGLSLKLVDVLRWSKLNRLATKYSPSHRGLIHLDTERYLVRWCSIFVCLSVLCSIGVVVLSFLTP